MKARMSTRDFLEQLLSERILILDGAMDCYHEVEKIYAAAGASDKLELDLFDGGHRWGDNKTRGFFKRYL